ncbi:Outer membrane lipoprotein OmlA [Liberibacter crescens BT-1]|uniref:Outer membrane lipoprotein OmlA n=2 Tax=Liberibacter crescens TaxID=1273132 RepID=L0ES75_LIBCB|nr:outer membrane protein assembly factor BamE [Liberibacter crescens]AGA64354.1 Outer membrane lipoprotein OmlA [Liberibacter crescens BT-1]
MLLLISSIALISCTSFNSGYIVDEQSLQLVSNGSSREHVLASLGTPSTTATFDTEVFYYISQKRSQPLAFMKANIKNQSILAIYFNNRGVVTQISRYTLKNGKVFDMISRTTPTGGKDLTFLQKFLQLGENKSFGSGIPGSNINNNWRNDM